MSISIILSAEGEFERLQRELTGAQVTGLRLSDMFERMGMGAPFDPILADFTAMYDREAADRNPDQEVALTEIFHEVTIVVDETGTEASAATGVIGGMQTTSYEGPEMYPFYMVVDRPFLVVLRDRETGTLLFLGQVVDAAATQE